jgi:hypothetical protein
MNRESVQLIVGAVAVLGLAAFSVTLGANLLPPRAVAEAKGTLGPWILTWGMVWMAVLASVILAGFLVATSLGKTEPSD